MGLFSFFRKDKQKGDSARDSSYVSRSASDTMRQRSQRNTAKNEAKSPDVPENRRARRRLVGAIVLVLAIVIILPRIFDSQPNPHQDITLQIPDQAKTDHAIDVPANPAQAPVTNSVTPAPANANVTIDNDSEEEVISSAPLPDVTSSPSVTNNAAPAAPVSPEMPAPVAKPSVQAPVAKTPEVTKPTPKPAPNKAKDEAAESARALAILEGKSPAKVTEKSTSNSSDNRKFVVQVAALSDPAKVAALRQRLSSAGINSFTQQIKTASGETTRIRVGPFNGKDAAESMRTKINRLGLNASVMPA